jgi:ABC-type cobalamin/Fe3+-siderophores transport system ATPase subunit
MASERAWQLQDVAVGYGDVTILRELSAELPRGAITTVLGPGGSGKSTLLRALEGKTAGLWATGSMPLLPAWRLPQPSRVRGRACEPELLAAARARVEAWLAMHPSALPSAAEQALLHGELGLVRAARVLAARDAELLLLDEPDVHLASAVTRAFAAMLRVLAREGSTIVLVTHDLALVHEISDHLLLLVDGIKLDEGVPTRVHAHPASERVRSFFTWGT